jgi:endoglucanase
MGTNLSGMEWARPGLRYGQSTKPNMNITVPRASDVKYLAANGFSKNRLPIQWEMLQPVLHDTNANSTVQSIVGAPGAFHPGYAAYITGVLDAHAAAGVKCIIDLHNYCRYQDFVYQADGSVLGLTKASDPLIHPYTTNNTQVHERIMSLASGSRLKIANFTDFWTRAAQLWKGHPGFGGYGLMNEPHDMPKAGGTTAFNDPWVEGNAEDLTIWPTFAQAAINAIRAVDQANPIYVSGNYWDSAMSLATDNPGFPLAGANLIYEIHAYLDAYSNGHKFDWDTEVAKGYSAGEGGMPISVDTGWKRLKLATDWAAAKGVKLALTEMGMPLDDPRWQESFARAMTFASQQGVEVYSWMGGNHWPIHSYAINHAPGWHQNKTLEPAVAGPMKAALGVSRAVLFDDGAGFAPSGTSVTITVYARGFLASPVSLSVSSSNGGTLSKSLLTLPAGPNSQDSYTFTSSSNTVTTLTYSGAAQVPPPRKVYSLTDPVAYIATNLEDAAMAILAKYGACKWVMADGHTDYMQGVPAADGQPVRAVSDSGYGSSAGNAMEMINWINKEGSMGTMSLPVMRTTNGKRHTDHTVDDTWGLWCKKSEPQAGVQPNPKNRVPYNIQDNHFAIAAVSVPGSYNTGLVFQGSKTDASHTSELAFDNSQPRARWMDENGQTVTLTSPARLVANQPAVVSMTSVPGAQRLRVNSAVVGSASATMGPGSLTQMLIGWGYVDYYPRGGFMGNIYAVIAGKGAPTSSEIAVLERYLGTTAGVVL